MIITREDDLITFGPLRWLVPRLAVYFAVALFVGQAFIGVVGLGKGGEWIISALACEMFCAFWIVKQYGWLPWPAFRLMGAVRNPRGLRIISASPEVPSVSLLEASEAESVVLRRFLGSTTETGTAFVMDGTNKDVLGVLLSRDEYELLTSAAMIARDPERLEEFLHGPADMGVGVESFDEAFGVRGR
jgi:hypothetical protein